MTDFIDLFCHGCGRSQNYDITVTSSPRIGYNIRTLFGDSIKIMFLLYLIVFQFLGFQRISWRP